MAWLGALTLAWASPAGARTVSDDLETLAAAHVAQALQSTLPDAVRAMLTLDIRILGERGAAQTDCPSGWVLGEIAPAQPWQRMSIRVACGSAQGSVVARIRAQAPVWTLRSDRPAGHTLAEKDMARVQRRVQGADDLVPFAALLGMQLRRNAKTGHTLGLQDVERPVLARKGDIVEIRASGAEGITVSVAGIATQTGRLGDTARVRNARSQQWISGRWVGPGILEAD